MATTTTPVLGLTLPTPNTDEPWSLTTYNANLTAIDSAIGAKTSKFTTTTVANTTTETSIGGVTIPANSPQGSVWHLALWGSYGNQAVAGTLTFRVKLGGTTIHTFAISTPATAFTGQTFKVEEDIVILTTGASANWNGSAFGFVKTSNNINTIGDVATVTKDQTAAQLLEITVQWSAANASNTLAATGGYGSRITNA